MNINDKLKSGGLRSIALKITLFVLAVGLVATLVIGYVSYRQAKASLEAKNYAMLEAIREIKKGQIESYFNERKGDAQTFSSLHEIQEALMHFDVDGQNDLTDEQQVSVKSQKGVLFNFLFE